MQKRPLVFSTVLSGTALALALAGCGTQPGADDDVDGANSGTPVPSSEQATASAEASETGGTAAATSSASPEGEATEGGDVNTAQDAIETVQSQVGGQATELDFDDDQEWEITVVENSESTDATVASDGGELKNQEDPESLDSDDQKEFDAAQISLADAITTAADEYPGNIDDAELTTEDGTVVFKVDLYRGSDNDEISVYVDAANGDIVKTS